LIELTTHSHTSRPTAEPCANIVTLQAATDVRKKKETANNIIFFALF
jgi:hypothetical protein